MRLPGQWFFYLLSNFQPTKNVSLILQTKLFNFRFQVPSICTPLWPQLLGSCSTNSYPKLQIALLTKSKAYSWPTATMSVITPTWNSRWKNINIDWVQETLMGRRRNLLSLKEMFDMREFFFVIWCFELGFRIWVFWKWLLVYKALKLIFYQNFLHDP
jgi:hypothetical protein